MDGWMDEQNYEQVSQFQGPAYFSRLSLSIISLGKLPSSQATHIFSLNIVGFLPKAMRVAQLHMYFFPQIKNKALHIVYAQQMTVD